MQLFRVLYELSRGIGRLKAVASLNRLDPLSPDNSFKQRLSIAL